MKTLFVILDSGTSIRNILRTDVLAVLKRRTDVRIVVFSPVVDNEFRAEFETENVIVEKVRKWSPNIPVRIARSLKKDFWAERAGIFTFKSRRKRKERRFANWFLLKMLSGNGDHRRLDALI
ncbi:MAG: hypothetical protein L7F78_16155, partial [Syntrophales bacterium LBB04]|nr:hypothetical protein [Syntrophales bacterium LBB04]